MEQPPNPARGQGTEARGPRAGRVCTDPLLPSSACFPPISDGPDYFLTSIIHTQLFPHLQNPSGQELLIHTEFSITRCSINTGE